MADIFISYSKHDPEPTKALATELEVLGYTTWWDTSLLPGERFPDKIRQELEAAAAVIVIWSDASAKSEWVQSEAQLAQALGKLITVHVSGFDLKKIPMPFNTRHTEPIENRAKIYLAIRQYIFRPNEDLKLAVTLHSNQDIIAHSSEPHATAIKLVSAEAPHLLYNTINIIEKILAAIIVLAIVSLLIFVTLPHIVPEGPPTTPPIRTQPP